MSLKSAHEIAERIKTTTASTVNTQTLALILKIEKKLDTASETFVEVEVPLETRFGVISKVFDSLRDLGYKLCLVETLNEDGSLKHRTIRVSVSHLVEQ